MTTSSFITESTGGVNECSNDVNEDDDVDNDDDFDEVDDDDDFDEEDDDDIDDDWLPSLPSKKKSWSIASSIAE